MQEFLQDGQPCQGLSPLPKGKFLLCLCLQCRVSACAVPVVSGCTAHSFSHPGTFQGSSQPIPAGLGGTGHRAPCLCCHETVPALGLLLMPPRLLAFPLMSLSCVPGRARSWSPRSSGKFNFSATIGLTAPAGGADLGALFSALNISLNECLQGGGWIIFSTASIELELFRQQQQQQFGVQLC